VSARHPKLGWSVEGCWCERASSGTLRKQRVLEDSRGFRRVYHAELPQHAAVLAAQKEIGVNPGANLKSISRRCHPILVVFVCELTKETMIFPLGCLQGGERRKLPRRAPAALHGFLAD